MPELYDLEVVYYVIPKPATPPPTEVTEIEWLALEARVDDLEDGQALDDLTDVDTTGATDGAVLVFDEETDTWGPGGVSGGIPEIEDGGDAINTVPVTTLWANAGLSATETTPGTVDLSVIFDGTGVENKAARSDHSHSAPIGKRAAFVATGVLSSGTRSLVNTTFGPLTSGIVYDVEAFFVVRARNNVNSGTFNLQCRIGGAAEYPTVTRNVQTVGGVPVDQLIDFGDANGDRVITGSGVTVAITFSAQFSSGDAVDIRDGWYRVIAKPRR